MDCVHFTYGGTIQKVLFYFQVILSFPLCFFSHMLVLTCKISQKNFMIHKFLCIYLISQCTTLFQPVPYVTRVLSLEFDWNCMGFIDMERIDIIITLSLPIHKARHSPQFI